MTHASDAYTRLTLAMEQQTPSCDGIDAFTSDTLDREDRANLAAICADCPLQVQCAEYARAAKPTAGYWAGITTQKREKK